MANEVYFRAGVGVLVINEENLVLTGERSTIPGAWQAPQGGLLPGEDLIDGARRELHEELGLVWDEVEVLDEHDEWLGYELPSEARSAKTGRGQVHRWFLVRYRGTAIDVRRGDGAEFTDWRWESMASLVEHVWSVRRPVYRRLAEVWADYFRPRS